MGDDPVETPSRSCAVHLRCMLGPTSGVSLPLIITVGHAIWDAYFERAGPSGPSPPPGGDPGQPEVVAPCPECRPLILTQSSVDVEALKIELRWIVALVAVLCFALGLVIGNQFPRYGWNRKRDRGAWSPPRRGAGVVVAGSAH